MARTVFTAVALVSLVCSVCSQERETPSIEALVKQLGSRVYRQREQAAKALLDRPESEEALRAAIHSKDLEVARRLAAILDERERRRSPFIGLDRATEAGEIEQVIKAFVEFPQGKSDDLLWTRFDRICSALVGRYQTNMKGRTGSADHLTRPRANKTIVAKRFTSASSTPKQIDFCLSATEIHYIWPRGAADENLICGLVAVVNGPVRLKNVILTSPRIIAAGDVEIDAGIMGPFLILSGGNVTLGPTILVDQSLVIARGEVRVGALSHSQVISGKRVTHIKQASVGSIISEKDPNPLGYIRWSDAPK